MSQTIEWISVSEEKPPQNTVVDTKVDDKDGIRNEQKLQLKSRMWWHPDGSIFVYYTPTHWKPAT